MCTDEEYKKTLSEQDSYASRLCANNGLYINFTVTLLLEIHDIANTQSMQYII